MCAHLVALILVERRSKAAVKYRDGQCILLAVFDDEARNLERAGFRAHALRLSRHDGTMIEGDLWIQDDPKLIDYLRAAALLFDDEPGSVTW